MAVCLQGGWVTGSQPTVADDKLEWGVLRHVLCPHKNHRGVLAGVMLSAGHARASCILCGGELSADNFC